MQGHNLSQSTTDAEKCLVRLLLADVWDQLPVDVHRMYSYVADDIARSEGNLDLTPTLGYAPARFGKDAKCTRYARFYSATLKLRTSSDSAPARLIPGDR